MAEAEQADASAPGQPRCKLFRAKHDGRRAIRDLRTVGNFERWSNAWIGFGFFAGLRPGERRVTHLSKRVEPGVRAILHGHAREVIIGERMTSRVELSDAAEQ